MKELLSWTVSLGTAVLIALLIRSFVFTLITVKGGSMLNTLRTGDKLYVSILSASFGSYERGDIVICRYPGRRDYCVKRVIGLPGDTVSARDGIVSVNGTPLEEDYLTFRAHYSYPERTLAEDEYFLLGDNRPISHDSHSSDVGPVTDIVGKARFRFWPPDRIGGIYPDEGED